MQNLIKRSNGPAIGRRAVNDTAEAPEGAEAQKSARKCLIVDDSRVIRKVSRQIIQTLGYVIDEAENGHEALEKCKAQGMPDLIMLDWDMPVMTGIEFVSALRGTAGGAHPKVVFCTTKNGSFDIHDGIEAGANEYVIKPFDHDTLLEKLKRIGAA